MYILRVRKSTHEQGKNRDRIPSRPGAVHAEPNMRLERTNWETVT